MVDIDNRKIDFELDCIFGCGCDEPVPVSLMRAAAKSIASNYPRNEHSSMAIMRIISAARHLKQAESDAKASLP